MRKLLFLIACLALAHSCGGGSGGSALDAFVPEGGTADVPAQEVSYPGYDVSPEAMAGARPLAEVEFLPTSGQKPPGDEPDLTPFLKGKDPWCEQEPLGPGQDPGCVSLSKQFGCKYVKNPGPVGAWLKPGVSMLFCAACEPAADPVDCECVSESVSTIPTPLGGTLCLDAIVFESIAPEKVTDRAALLDRFKPIEDEGEALAFTSFEPGIAHAFNHGEFLKLGPGATTDPEFVCVLPKVFGTLAFPAAAGFEVQTFKVPEGQDCPKHAIERVTLVVKPDGSTVTKSSELVCSDPLDACSG